MLKLARLSVTESVWRGSAPRACITLNCMRGGESDRLRAPPQLDSARRACVPSVCVLNCIVRMGCAAPPSSGTVTDENGLVAENPNCCRSVHGLAMMAPCALYILYSE